MAVRLPILTIVLIILSTNAGAADPVFRTDGGDDKLPWFRLKSIDFPPAGAAHAISGELISVDHVNRSGVLRVDRNGSQRTDDYDQPLPFTLLPFGSVRSHGAPADLRDVPLGTHLHGQFFVEDKGGKQVFSKVLKLVDDFSLMEDAKRLWRVDDVALDKQTLNLTGISADGKADEKPTKFQIFPSTRVWQGRSIGSTKDVLVGQLILMNPTVCTLKGPGRCTDIWIDAESRAVATAQQLELHRHFERERGLPCRVDEVDNPNHLVTMTIFDGVDRALVDEFRVKDHIAVAVAEENLRTHDQNNDTARGPITDRQELTPGPGNSGVRITFKPSELLEGYRPNRIVRIFSGGWRVDDLLLEERFYEK